MKQDFSNKKVGDKMWSIQLGECKVIDINLSCEYPIICRNSDGIKSSYALDGYHWKTNAYPSLFESNPFENQFQERVMEVSRNCDYWYKRVVFMEKNGCFIAWDTTETIKESKDSVCAYGWKYAREIKEEKKKVILELTDEQIESLKEQGIL